MLMKLSQKITITQILAVTLIFVWGIAVELTWAQLEKEEMPQKDRVNLIAKKKLEESRVRNPFLLPPGIHLLSKGGSTSPHPETAAKPDTKSEEIDLLRVRAILVSDHVRLASIGGTIVTVGDRVNGEKVLEIKTDQVILEKGDKKRTLRLYQSPVKLTTEEKQ
jgi:hypothetical protein